MLSRIWIHPLAVAIVAGALFSTIAIGCGGSDKDCVTICKEAQAANCTSIKDCDKTCRVTKAVADKAGCQSQWDAYDSCANSTETCKIDATCSSQQSALTNCGGAWCLQNAADPDCKELLTL